MSNGPIKSLIIEGVWCFHNIFILILTCPLLLRIILFLTPSPVHSQAIMPTNTLSGKTGRAKRPRVRFNLDYKRIHWGRILIEFLPTVKTGRIQKASHERCFYFYCILCIFFNRFHVQWYLLVWRFQWWVFIVCEVRFICRSPIYRFGNECNGTLSDSIGRSDWTIKTIY